MLSKQWAPVYLFPISMMDADYNKHTAFCFSPLSHHISFSFPFSHLNTVFLDGARMATARFDMSVAMEEHLNNCGCSCTMLLINWIFNILNLFEDWAWFSFVSPREILDRDSEFPVS